MCCKLLFGFIEWFNWWISISLAFIKISYLTESGLKSYAGTSIHWIKNSVSEKLRYDTFPSGNSVFGHMSSYMHGLLPLLAFFTCTFAGFLTWNEGVNFIWSYSVSMKICCVLNKCDWRFPLTRRNVARVSCRRRLIQFEETVKMWPF